MSYLEIYLEEVKDLLRPGGDDEIHIREDDKGNTIVQGGEDIISSEVVLIVYNILYLYIIFVESEKTIAYQRMNMFRITSLAFSIKINKL